MSVESECTLNPSGVEHAPLDYQPVYHQINEEVLRPLGPPRPIFYVTMMLLASVIGWAGVCWMYQINTGMGVAGISHPVGWGVYIADFVFWVGIAHSGTLISAILYLVRSRWRSAVARAAEAMTVFAVMTAGLFPLIHLGRLWVLYYILPYPSARQLWPNFQSPLVWDVVAVSTYMTVSSLFFFVGLIPDLAAARDRSECVHGKDHPMTWLYRLLSLGWTGSGNQWRHHGRAYLFFAALATPLVISVHSVVSWDFAMGLLPGWHTTIFAPYFVAGAIHSGLAMVLTLLIPMRRILRIERWITMEHFRAVAETMIVTTLIVGYSYTIEPFISWYSGDLYEQQFALWRAVGWLSPMYYALFACNVFAPALFLFRAVRTNLKALFIISVLVNIGMWLERVFIVVGSTSHDFLPHNWGMYAPTWVEASISVGSFAWFFFLYLGFTKIFPAVGIADVKEDMLRDAPIAHEAHEAVAAVPEAGRSGLWRVWAVYPTPEALVTALKHVQAAACGPVEVYSPRRMEETEPMMGRGPSPVRYWTLAGALSGLTAGFALAIGTALVNNLVVGGKHAVSILPYCVVGFECTILFGVLANFAGMLFHGRLIPFTVPNGYDPRFSCDRYGICVSCPVEGVEFAKDIIAETQPEDIHVAQ